MAAICGGLVLWSDMRTLQTATIPALERTIEGLRAELVREAGQTAELRKAIEANSLALAVLDARSQRHGRDHGRQYQGLR